MLLDSYIYHPLGARDDDADADDDEDGSVVQHVNDHVVAAADKDSIVHEWNEKVMRHHQLFLLLLLVVAGCMGNGVVLVDAAYSCNEQLE